MATDVHNDLAETTDDSVGFCKPPPRRQAGIRITVIARMLRNMFDRKAVTLGVTRSQWSMIGVISNHPGLTQRSIAEHLELSEASAGRLIDRLCDEGLIERRERRGDRRARAVYLTEEALPIQEQLCAVAAAAEQRLFAGFSDEEIEQVLGYLDRLYRNASRG